MVLKLIRPGGRVASVEVYGQDVTLDVAELWIRNITIVMGRVNANTGTPA